MKKFNRHHLTLGLVLACSAYLTLMGLDNTAFWEDEAQVGIIARNFLKTGELTGWDGRNLYGYRSGRVLDARLHTVHPPLMFLTCAASFQLFGVNTWAGRIPFAAAGLAALVVFAFLLRHEFGADRWVWLYVLGGVGLSPVYLLYIRQCRYYSLGILFAVVIFYAYRKLVSEGRPVALVWMAGCGIMMYYANYLQCAAFLAALGLTILLCDRKVLGRRQLLGLGAAGVVFLAATLPHAVANRIWVREEDIFNTDSWLGRHLILPWWHFRDLNAMGAMPWVLGLGVAFVIFRKAPGDPRQGRMRAWALLAGANVFFISLLSPQSTSMVTRIADMRYLTAALPFLLGLGGLFLVWLHGKSRPAALGLFVVSLASTLPTVTLSNPRPRWLLPGYLHEIHHEYPTAFGEAVRFLQQDASQDDLVLTWMDNKMYPLMFYTGDRIQFGCQIYPGSPLEEVASRLDAPLLVEGNYPVWIILFGYNEGAQKMLEIYSWPHQEAGKRVQYAYKLFRTLDVYQRDTHRPELNLHEFWPQQEFNRRNDAVYIFRRTVAAAI